MTRGSDRTHCVRPRDRAVSRPDVSRVLPSQRLHHRRGWPLDLTAPTGSAAARAARDDAHTRRASGSAAPHHRGALVSKTRSDAGQKGALQGRAEEHTRRTAVCHGHQSTESRAPRTGRLSLRVQLSSTSTWLPAGAGSYADATGCRCQRHCRGATLVASARATHPAATSICAITVALCSPGRRGVQPASSCWARSAETAMNSYALTPAGRVTMGSSSADRPLSQMTRAIHRASG